MNITEIINCKTCNQPRQYLDHEKIIKIDNHEGDIIGQNRKSKAVNLRLYCKNCRYNYSEIVPYNDEKYIPAFIKDVKDASAHFDKMEFMEIPS